MKRTAFLIGILLTLVGAVALAAQPGTSEQFSAHMAQMQALMNQAQGTNDPAKHRELMQQHAAQMTQAWQLMSQMMDNWAQQGMQGSGSGGGSGMMGSKGGMGGQGMGQGMMGGGKSMGPGMMQQHMQMLQMLMDQMQMHEHERMRMHDQ